MVFTSFLIINVDAKTDYHLEWGGGIISLLYTGNEHVVMNENGDEMGYAFVGRNGDSSYVNFLYKDMPSCTLCEKGIRQTTNLTPMVAIARDKDFNIYTIYSERRADTLLYYLYYKKFDWSTKTWDFPLDKLGYKIYSDRVYPTAFDIKVDLAGNIHVISCHWSSDLSALLYDRYNSVLGAWDLTKEITSKASDYGVHRDISIALDSNDYIYCTYSVNQSGVLNLSDAWFTKSVNGGDDWSSPLQLVNKTVVNEQANTVTPCKLLIDNSDILHFVSSQSFDGVWDQKVCYIFSNDYGDTWSENLNVTTSNHVFYPSITKDASNIMYFTYTVKSDWNFTYSAIRGKKYENNVLGDNISIAYASGSNMRLLNTVFSNTYNQYADDGIIGIYEDGRVANYEIRYLEMTRNDFIVGQHEIWITPDKLTYYTFDTITIHVTNQNPFSMQWRVIDSTGTWVEEMYKTGSAEYTDTGRTLMIPNGYTSGTWRVQVRSPWSESWGDIGNEYFNFTVEDSGLGYGISAFPSWVIKGNWVSCSFTAKKDESYMISLWYSTDPMGGEPRYIGNVTTTEYAVNQNVTIDYLFSMFNLGGYVLHLRNSTTGNLLAMSNFFAVGDEPFENTYTVDIGDRYRYTDKPIVTVHRFGSKSYSFTIYNENDILIMSHVTAISDYTFQFVIDEGDIGTAYIIVHDADGDPSDSNAVRIEFQIYDPQATTGDPVLDTFIGIPTWVKAIVGVIIVLGFVFIPFTLSHYIAGRHKLDVPPVIYAICGGIGVTLCTVLGLFGWEIMFFICVISGISLVISYVWQHRGD